MSNRRHTSLKTGWRCPFHKILRQGVFIGEALGGEARVSGDLCECSLGHPAPLLLSLPGGAGATLQLGQGIVEAGGDCLGETGGKLVVTRHTLGSGHRQRCLDSGFLSHCGDASYFLS